MGEPQPSGLAVAEETKGITNMKITKEELAARLTGREYGSEIATEESALAKDSGLVVVFGYSDDCMELRGAVDDEVSCYKRNIIITKKGVMLPFDECDHECEEAARAWFMMELLPRAVVSALWSRDGYSWTYDCDIPHATFEIVEGDEKFCRGIVFAVADMKEAKK